MNGGFGSNVVSGSTSGDIHTVDLTAGKNDFECVRELWQIANS